ncbi:MAG TPA: hypothetical protein PKA74_14535 [Bauldia sp.]|nr:hypothetical protein [Bauldia sp.]
MCVLLRGPKASYQASAKRRSPTRRTWRGEVPVTRSRFLYPGDRYRLRSAHDAFVRGTPLATTAGRGRNGRRLA